MRKIRCSALLTIALISLILLSFTEISISAQHGNTYIYYGYIPSRIFVNEFHEDSGRWEILKDTIMDHGTVGIIGITDATDVKVYTLPDNRLVKNARIGRYEKLLVDLPNGTLFKICSTNPVSVMLMGGRLLDKGQLQTSTFFTSVDGGYVGKEFIFLQVGHPYFYPVLWVGWHYRHFGFSTRVMALEDSHITLKDENGRVIMKFDLKANEEKTLNVTHFRVYHLVSTGNVMVHSYTGGRSIFYPAIYGGFLGRVFYGGSNEQPYWKNPAYENWTFILTSTEDNHIRVIDVHNRRLYFEMKIASMNATRLHINTPFWILESKKPVILMWKSSDYKDGGLSILGLRANQTAAIYIPPRESYIFPYKDTIVTIDDIKMRLHEDEPYRLREGLHVISTTENILIEVVNMQRHQGVGTFAVCLPSIQSLNITHKGLKIKPPLQFETGWRMPSWAYYIILVIAIILIAVALKIRR